MITAPSWSQVPSGSITKALPLLGGMVMGGTGVKVVPFSFAKSFPAVWVE